MQEPAASVAPYLANMPAEILNGIFQYLTQHELNSTMLTCKSIIEIAVVHLYHTPIFISTYRFAQFALVVARKPCYAKLVRTINLSNISPDLPSCSPTASERSPESDSIESEIPNLAGWREFQHINTDLYTIYLTGNCAPPLEYSPVPSGKKVAVSFKRAREVERRGAVCYYAPQAPFLRSTHPPPAYSMRKFWKRRDVPIGALCRVFAACANLRYICPNPFHNKVFPQCHRWLIIILRSKINLSHLLLAADCLVLPDTFPPPILTAQRSIVHTVSSRLWNSKQRTNSPFTFPTAELAPSCLSFITDAPPATYFDKDEQVVPVYADDVVYHLSRLKYLESLEVRGCTWFTTDRAWFLLCGSVAEEMGFDQESETKICRGKESKNLKDVDFGGCGAMSGDWTIKGSREDVERLVRRAIEDK
jgi:hypothetical protein